VVVLVGWLVSAVFVVWSTTIQSEQVDELVGEPLRRQTAARQVAAQRLLAALLEPAAAGLPGHYEIRAVGSAPWSRCRRSNKAAGSEPATC